jgi:hypothetical protein
MSAQRALTEFTVRAVENGWIVIEGDGSPRQRPDIWIARTIPELAELVAALARGDAPVHPAPQKADVWQAPR